MSFDIKIHNLRYIRHIKEYKCFCVCLATEAAHIEMVTELTTESYIVALTQFVSIGGFCSDLYSDYSTKEVKICSKITSSLKIKS